MVVLLIYIFDILIMLKGVGHTHRYKFGFKKKSSKESQYMVSHPELGLDPPIGSNRETGCDSLPNFHFYFSTPK